jgi:hypothetical protein
MLVMGKPGAGKSSHIYGMLTDPKMLAGIFERGTVYVIAPPSSIDSFGPDSAWSELNPNQFYSECSDETLAHVERRILNNRRQDKKSLLLLDDVQKDLKGPCRQRLEHLVANRRHQWLWIILAAQTYKTIPLSVRQMATDLFCFNLSKKTMLFIYEELIEMDNATYTKFFNYYKKHYRNELQRGRRKPFFYINTSGPTIFSGWERELLHDEDDQNPQGTTPSIRTRSRSKSME